MKLSVAFVVAFLAAAHCQKMTPVVKTKYGDVQGRVYDTEWYSKEYWAFLGIPYAEPPVGYLRFRDPVPKAPWSGTLRTIEDHKICAQTLVDGQIGDEDCLYINVYVPQNCTNNNTENDSLPVMVWIYGGGFTTGYSLKGVYGMDNFMEQCTIVVSFNYRLNIFGFLYLGVDGINGNQGLKDQNLALKWVKENIEAFGGDSDHITIFGESAGAASVGYQVLSPKSQGLFNQAIMQSGSPLCPWAYLPNSQLLTNAFTVVARMGHAAIFPEDVLSFLQSAESEKITNVVNMMTTSTPAVYFPFVPTTDGDFLDDCPVSKFQSGNFNHVPMLTGFNDEEAILFNIQPSVLNEMMYMDMQALYNASLPNMLADLVMQVSDFISSNNMNATIETLAPVAKVTTTTDACITRKKKEQVELTQDISKRLLQYASAYYFAGPVDLTQRYFVEFNGDKPTYFYRLSADSVFSLHSLISQTIHATSHADDLGYLFNIPVVYPLDPEHPVNVFRRSMVTLWANFAKYGNPTPDGSNIAPAWLPSGEVGLQYNIDMTCTMNNGRLLTDSEVQITQAYYNTLPITAACKNFEWSNGSPYK